MSTWTMKQEEIIRERCYEGAEAVRDAIERECGVRHSTRAVEMHASRMCVSLKVLGSCPECGAVGVRINRQSGMCRRCTANGHVAEEEAFHELLRLEVEGCDGGPEVERAERKYAQLRQANSRLVREHGLPGKRDRKIS